MNRAKSVEKEQQVEDVEVGTVEVKDPFTVIQSGDAAKLGAKSKGKILYDIALNGEDGELYLRIAGLEIQGGLHSKEWILLSDMFKLIESQGDKAWKSQLYRSLFRGMSSNNPPYCAGIIRNGLQLTTRAGSSIYLHQISDDYAKKKAELIALAKPVLPAKK